MVRARASCPRSLRLAESRAARPCFARRRRRSRTTMVEPMRPSWLTAGTRLTITRTAPSTTTWGMETAKETNRPRLPEERGPGRKGFLPFSFVSHYPMTIAAQCARSRLRRWLGTLLALLALVAPVSDGDAKIKFDGVRRCDRFQVLGRTSSRDAAGCPRKGDLRPRWALRTEPVHFDGAGAMPWVDPGLERASQRS